MLLRIRSPEAHRWRNHSDFPRRQWTTGVAAGTEMSCSCKGGICLIKNSGGRWQNYDVDRLYMVKCDVCHQKLTC